MEAERINNRSESRCDIGTIHLSVRSRLRVISGPASSNCLPGSFYAAAAAAAQPTGTARCPGIYIHTHLHTRCSPILGHLIAAAVAAAALPYAKK